ncbi:MAG: DUF4337 family protein [Opitutaceae bacterium]
MAALPKITLKAQIPEELKAEVAQTPWGKVLSVTPVVMTVIATMLAGLASSEMTRAQYDRSLAAQRQSKAGDQWGFFQSKRLRAVMLRGTLDLMVTAEGSRALDVTALRRALGDSAAGTFDSPAGQAALAALTSGTLPRTAPAPAVPPPVAAALAAIEAARPDEEVARLVFAIAGSVLDGALREQQMHALALDAQLEPVGSLIGTWEKQLAGQPLLREFIAARLRFHSQRYDAEARLNQTIAQLFELQVRASNLAAERHHRRSGRFFYGMLAAQLAVIVSTFALAARRRTLLWTIAAGAGAVALAFTVYVLLFV